MHSKYRLSLLKKLAGEIFIYLPINAGMAAANATIAMGLKPIAMKKATGKM